MELLELSWGRKMSVACSFFEDARLWLSRVEEHKTCEHRFWKQILFARREMQIRPTCFDLIRNVGTGPTLQIAP